jgi:hypothetical protein
VPFESLADIEIVIGDVCLPSKADIGIEFNVRYVPEADIRSLVLVLGIVRGVAITYMLYRFARN